MANLTDLNTRYLRNSNLIVTDMAGEKVMLSVENGKYYNLGEISGGIWDILAHPVTTKEIVSCLVDAYEVNERKCEEEVAVFIEMLLQERLIEVVEQ